MVWNSGDIKYTINACLCWSLKKKTQNENRRIREKNRFFIQMQTKTNANVGRKWFCFVSIQLFCDHIFRHKLLHVVFFLSIVCGWQ